MTPTEAASLLCEDCEISAQRHNDRYWGHLCDGCFTALCDPDWYGRLWHWPVDEANAWGSSEMAYAYLDPTWQRVHSVPYSWEVFYA